MAKYKQRPKSAYRPRKNNSVRIVFTILFFLIIITALLLAGKLVIDYVISPPIAENPQVPEIINIDTSNREDKPNQSTGLTGSITYTAVEDDKLIIRVNIDQIVGEYGTCSLTLSKAGRKDIIKAVNTMDNPSSSTCQGFDIPIKELAKGVWNIRINLSVGGKLGVVEGRVEL